MNIKKMFEDAGGIPDADYQGQITKVEEYDLSEESFHVAFTYVILDTEQKGKSITKQYKGDSEGRFKVILIDVRQIIGRRLESFEDLLVAIKWIKTEKPFVRFRTELNGLIQTVLKRIPEIKEAKSPPKISVVPKVKIKGEPHIFTNEIWYFAIEGKNDKKAQCEPYPPYKLTDLYLVTPCYGQGFAWNLTSEEADAEIEKRKRDRGNNE